MKESQELFYILKYITPAILLTVLLSGGCSQESPTEVPTKRESHFEVTDVIPAPGRGTEDIVYTAGSLWVSDSDGTGSIYRISATDGTVQAQNQPEFGPPGSLVTADGSLYVADKYGGGIHKIAANDRMDVLDNYDTGLTEIRGLFYKGAMFYAYDYAEGVVFELDGDFSIEGAYPIDVGPRHLRGLRMIEGTLWSADAKRGWVNTHDDAFVIDSEFVTVCNYPRGIAWDGEYMYLGDPAGREIYLMDISQ